MEKQFMFDCMCKDPIFLHKELEPHEKGHPQTVMKNLGFNVIRSVPQSIVDAWFFLCDKWPETYPEYIREIENYPFDDYCE